MEKPYSGSIPLRPSIKHVVYNDPEASVNGDLLRPGAVRHTTAAGSLLPTTPPSSPIPAPSTNLLLPTSASSLQRRVASPGLLLPTPDGQSPVDHRAWPQLT